MVVPPADDKMPEPVSPDRAAPRRPLTLFPADDRRFRDAVHMAVELFPAGTDGQGTSSSPRLLDDERLLAAAQAMLRGAYPLATILGDRDPTASHAGAWQVFRDPASLDGALLRAARSGHPDAVTHLADRYQTIAFLFAWMICGEPVAAMAAVTDALAELVRSEELVEGEHLADTYLRLARRSALARRTSATVGEADEARGARVRLSTMLARLPASQAMAVSLAYGEGLSEAEVALAVSSDEGRTRASIREGLAALVDAPRSTGAHVGPSTGRSSKSG